MALAVKLPCKVANRVLSSLRVEDVLIDEGDTLLVLGHLSLLDVELELWDVVGLGDVAEDGPIVR